MNENTIAFIGAGNMARSVIAALVKQGYPKENIIATNPTTPKLDALAADFGIEVSTDNIKAVKLADVIVLCVKPQMMAQVCTELLAGAPEIFEKLFVTVAAGLPVAHYQRWLGEEVRLVRAMPNTPAQVGLGVTGLFPHRLSNYEKSFVDQLFSGCGITSWLEKESQINDIIAVTGSAPAYFFYFMQAIQQGAEELGFAAEEARAMVVQTALGAATLALQSPLSFAELRAQVTSKGGTTHEAIERFKQGDLEALVQNAMKAAITRAEEMAKTL
ncbi:pyrroline-5-carboxylate reductase [Rheinheimera sp.]|uniref:pyrroline-5-carboxylate reductase n=1 Tax=Rheinheimera sp. TaxID=1869214 RepID=UPI0027B95B97|nr:pyrroline-5-carboxylate reductase [Rheinheimera sp.]